MTFGRVGFLVCFFSFFVLQQIKPASASEWTLSVSHRVVTQRNEAQHNHSCMTFSCLSGNWRIDKMYCQTRRRRRRWRDDNENTCGLWMVRERESGSVTAVSVSDGQRPRKPRHQRTLDPRSNKSRPAETARPARSRPRLLDLQIEMSCVGCVCAAR